MNLVSNSRRIGRVVLQRFRQDSGRQHMACRRRDGGSRVRQSRVGLASVADVKSAEVMSGPTGSAAPLIRETTVTKRNSSPGRARRKPLKPFACGNAGCSGDPVVTTVCLLPMHTGCGCHHAPGIPHALKGRTGFHNSGGSRREIVKLRFAAGRGESRSCWACLVSGLRHPAALLSHPRDRGPQR